MENRHTQFTPQKDCGPVATASGRRMPQRLSSFRPRDVQDGPPQGGFEPPTFSSGALTSDDELSDTDPILLSAQGPTQALGTYERHVLNDRNETTFRVVEQLGRGGFGVVSLCERVGEKTVGGREFPARFALKELISPKVFPVGKNRDVRDYLPLNEAALQRVLRHSSIVETYWADVRYLHPVTNEPLDIGLCDVEGDDESTRSWTPLDKLSDIEGSLSSALSCSHTVSSYKLKEVKLQMRIAMEHCNLGSLKDYLTCKPSQGGQSFVHNLLKLNRMSLSMSVRRCTIITALDMAEALKFMHKSKTVHGDIKPHNILLVSDPTGSETGFRAKISDFGLSKHMTKGQNRVNVSQGTEAYLSAEVSEHLAITEKSDVYALGLVMWELYYGICWHAVYSLEKSRRRRERIALPMGDYAPECSPSCPADFAAIVHSCLEWDPRKRPTATEVVSRLNGVIAGLEASKTQQQRHTPRGNTQ